MSKTVWNCSDYIKLPDCKPRMLYQIYSRNLILGVFDGKDGFLGIREKFNSRYIFTEYHWDGECFATVKPIKEIELVPAYLILEETLGSVDNITGRDVGFDSPLVEGGKGWYYLDTGESDQNIKPYCKGNKDLFEYLEQQEKLCVG